MASQRRAPTKRPPRPAAKKPPPPPGASEGSDAAEHVNGGKEGGKEGKDVIDARGKAPSKATTPNAGKAATPDAAKSGSSAAKSGSSTSAKSAPSANRPKTSPSGPTYRPPTGAPRSAARRPPPPPKRRKPRLTKQTIGAIVALALVGTLVVFFSLAVNGSTSSTSTTATVTPEGVAVPKGPVLAAVDTARYPNTIDGITCNTTEQLVYHIHAHLVIFVNGQARQIPYAIGIAPPVQYNTTKGTFVTSGSCFYWLHTHAADGIMHIESPTQTTYTLGQFFDMWGQPLKQGQVGPAVGAMKVFVDGKPYTGDPRAIPLTTHSQIQLDVGSPAPPQTLITFPSNL